MKNTKISSILSSGLIACALILGSLASTHSASAQGSMVLAKVNIPFAFQSGNETLPAGLYTIDREGAHVILLRGPKGAAGFAMTHEANRRQPSKQGTIVFAHYGDKYFLRQLLGSGIH